MMEKSLSVFRNEKKYLLTYEDTIDVRGRLDKLLLRDNYSGVDGYIVRSLYFDSINNIDYFTKFAGIEKRKKIRIRTYSSNNKNCKLELKQKEGDLQHKISIWITKEDAKELMKANFSILVKYFPTSKDAIIIYDTMVMGCYRPTVLVEYDRIAYIYIPCTVHVLH